MKMDGCMDRGGRAGRMSCHDLPLRTVDEECPMYGGTQAYARSDLLTTLAILMRTWTERILISTERRSVCVACVMGRTEARDIRPVRRARIEEGYVPSPDSSLCFFSFFGPGTLARYHLQMRITSRHTASTPRTLSPDCAQPR